MIRARNAHTLIIIHRGKHVERQNSVMAISVEGHISGLFKRQRGSKKHLLRATRFICIAQVSY